MEKDEIEKCSFSSKSLSELFIKHIKTIFELSKKNKIEHLICNYGYYFEKLFEDKIECGYMDFKESKKISVEIRKNHTDIKFIISEEKNDVKGRCECTYKKTEINTNSCIKDIIKYVNFISMQKKLFLLKSDKVQHVKNKDYEEFLLTEATVMVYKGLVKILYQCQNDILNEKGDVYDMIKKVVETYEKKQLQKNLDKKKDKIAIVKFYQRDKKDLKLVDCDENEALIVCDCLRYLHKLMADVSCYNDFLDQESKNILSKNLFLTFKKIHKIKIEQYQV